MPGSPRRLCLELIEPLRGCLAVTYGSSLRVVAQPLGVCSRRIEGESRLERFVLSFHASEARASNHSLELDRGHLRFER
jgi:hypothetical protein